MILKYDKEKNISVYACGKFYDFVDGILEIDGSKERKALNQLLENKNITKLKVDDGDDTNYELENDEVENEVE